MTKGYINIVTLMDASLP